MCFVFPHIRFRKVKLSWDFETELALGSYRYGGSNSLHCDVRTV
jgi:hypothetical protein